MKYLLLTLFILSSYFLLYDRENQDIENHNKNNKLVSSKENVREIASIEKKYNNDKDNNVNFKKQNLILEKIDCKEGVFINNKEVDCSSLKILKIGDVIRTKELSLLKIKMIDETIFTIAENTTVKISNYIVNDLNNKDISVDLLEGFLHTNMKNKVKIGKASINTKTTSLGIKGTEFITEYNSKHNKTKNILFHGLIEALITKDNVIKIKPNQYIEVSEDGEVIQKDYNENWVSYQELKFQKKWDRLVDNYITVALYKKSLIDKKMLKFSKKEFYLNELKTEIVDTISEIENLKELENEDKLKVVLNEKLKNFLNESYSEDTGRVEFNFDNSDESLLLEEQLNNYSLNRLNEISQVIQSTYSEYKAYPLVLENGEVVYFESNLELEALIPKDSEGNMLGVKVDEDLNPIRGEALYIKDEDLELLVDNLIPVINEYGEIERIPLLDDNNRLAMIPLVEENGEIKAIDIIENQENLNVDNNTISIYEEENDSKTKEDIEVVHENDDEPTDSNDEVTAEDNEENQEITDDNFETNDAEVELDLDNESNSKKNKGKEVCLKASKGQCNQD